MKLELTHMDTSDKFRNMIRHRKSLCLWRIQQICHETQKERLKQSKWSLCWSECRTPFHRSNSCAQLNVKDSLLCQGTKTGLTSKITPYCRCCSRVLFTFSETVERNIHTDGTKSCQLFLPNRVFHSSWVSRHSWKQDVWSSLRSGEASPIPPCKTTSNLLPLY